LQRRNTITRQMPPPRLIVEVISPGFQHRQRDAIDKRRQYPDIQVPEYWLIDPEMQTITILQLENSQYREHGVFQGSDRLHSPTLGDLPLSATQVLQAAP
jgi:Uma2 family endonuclease